MEDMDAQLKRLAGALENIGISPNETDRNFENANIVDGLYELSRAIRYAARLTCKTYLFCHGPEGTNMGVAFLDDLEVFMVNGEPTMKNYKGEGNL
jgi:hypothetical protein